MVRTKARLRLCTALLICNLIFIWGNSLLPGHLSGALSDWVRELLRLLLPGGQDRPSVGGGLLRKLAHFTEFTCLGLLLSWRCRMLRTKRWEHILLPMAAGVCAAALDECIQLFVPDRGPAVKDVGIDTLGILLGIVIISLAQAIKYKKIKNLEEIST